MKLISKLKALWAVGSSAVLGQTECSVTEYVVSVMDMSMLKYVFGVKPDWEEHSRHYTEDDAKFVERHLRFAKNKIARTQKVKTFYEPYKPSGIFA